MKVEINLIVFVCVVNDWLLWTLYSSTCHERTPSGPGKSVRTLQVAARHRDGWAGGGCQL